MNTVFFALSCSCSWSHHSPRLGPWCKWFPPFWQATEAFPWTRLGSLLKITNHDPAAFFRLEKLLASRGSPLQALSPSKMKICQLSIFPHTSWVLWDASWDISSFLFYTPVSFQPWKNCIFSHFPNNLLSAAGRFSLRQFAPFLFSILHPRFIAGIKNCTFPLFPNHPRFIAGQFSLPQTPKCRQLWRRRQPWIRRQ